MNRRNETEIENMRPVAWRPDGTPARFEVVEYDAAPVIGHDDAPIVAPVASDRLPRVQRIVEGSPVDEARAFNLKVSTLALVLGGGAVLAAAIFGASLSFWSALMWFGTVFAVVWAAAFALDALTSAGGVELFHAWRLWSFVDREQRHRHRRYDAPLTERQIWLKSLLFGLALVWTGGCVIALIVAISLENMPK